MSWLPFLGRKATPKEQNLGKRLGYGPHERLLIVHADDLGIAQSVNAAFIDGLATGLINSGSVIVPGGSLAEIAAFARAHPEVDIGLHLTLTSDSVSRPWAPIANPAQVPSLVDEHGNFLARWTSGTRINPREVEVELRAQIEKAYACGIMPTHLDSHRFRLQLGGEALFAVYLRVAREYRLPVMVPRHWFPRMPYLERSISGRDVVLDRMVIINGDVTAEEWPAFYRQAVERMQPGVTEFLIHLGYDNEELQELFEHRLPWGAAWRQRDLNFFTGGQFRDLLSQHDIKLITWRDIAARVDTGLRARIRGRLLS